MKLAVVILNYQGLAHLQTFLPSVLQYTEFDVYVADNGSSDESVNWLKNFPSVKIIQLDKNYGFAGGYNESLKQIDAEYYLLLNSDVAVGENWVNPLLDYLESNAGIAACQPKILSYQNPQYFEYAGASGGFIDKLYFPFCRGRLFDTCELDRGQYNEPIKVFWVTGACMLIRSSCFWEVNGFDSDFFAHMEEIDLCWRLQNRGYQMACVPASHVFHLGGGTLQSIHPNKTYLNFRNNLILAVKNDYRSGLVVRLIMRLQLDGMAALYLLYKRGWNHFIAVLKAHVDFYKQLKSTIRKRKSGRVMVQNNNRTGQFKRNIVLAYYLKGLKKFDSLEKTDFTN